MLQLLCGVASFHYSSSRYLQSHSVVALEGLSGSSAAHRKVGKSSSQRSLMVLEFLRDGAYTPCFIQSVVVSYHENLGMCLFYKYRQSISLLFYVVSLFSVSSIRK